MVMTVQFRGREIVHLDLGQKLLDRAVDTVKDLVKTVPKSRLNGKRLSLTLTPK